MTDPNTSLSKDGITYNLAELHQISKTDNINFNNGVITSVFGQPVNPEILATDGDTYLLIGDQDRTFALVLSGVPVISDIKATEIVAIAMSLGYGSEELKSTESAVFLPSPDSNEAESDAQALGSTLRELNDEDSISHIPPEILILVYSYLDVDSVLMLCQVSATFNRLCKDWKVWKDQVMKECPGSTWYEGVTYEQNISHEYWIETLQVCIAEKNKLGTLLIGNWNIDNVRELIAAGANLDTVDAIGYTALMMATLNGKFEMVELLVEAGANLDVASISGNTALIIATDTGNFEIAELLVDAGANLDMVNENGDTALLKATNKGTLSIFELLVDEGANLDVVDQFGETALIIATSKRHVTMAELLVDAGPNLDVVDKYGNTALIIATKRGKFEIVELLVDAGANLDVVNKDGDTALIIATKRGKFEIVEFLRASGAN
jgi:ankyrin repeat protein